MRALFTGATLKFSSLIVVARLKPYDTSTEQGRNQERNRLIALNMLSSLFARFVSGMTLLIVLPLTLDYLSAEEYGIWFVLTSSTALLAFADFGLGNGLLNAVAREYGKQNEDLIAKYISSAFFFLSGLVMFVLLMFAIVIYPTVQWSTVLNVTGSDAVAEARSTSFAFIMLFLLRIPLSLTGKVQTGYQQAYKLYFWESVGKIAGIGVLIVMIEAQASLTVLVVGVNGAMLVALGMNTISFFWNRPVLIPRWSRTDLTVGKTLLQTGVLFFLAQLMLAFSGVSDSFVGAQVLGATNLTEYSIAKQLFIAVELVFLAILNPLWPAYTEALARQDLGWLKRTFWRSIKMIGFPGAPLLAGLVLFGQLISQIWVGSEHIPPFLMLLGFGLYTAVNLLNSALSVLILSAGDIAFEVVFLFVMAVSNIGLSIVLAQRLGASGLVWSSFFVIGLFIVVPYSLRVISIFKRINPKLVQGKADYQEESES